MKKVLFVLMLLFDIHISYSQTVSLGNYNTSASQWIKLGNLALGQHGNDALVKFTGGSGYNASTSQQGTVTLHLRTSNATSLDANGYAFSATAVSYERSQFVYEIRIVPNAAGINVTSYALYIRCAPFPGNTYFTVDAPTGSWTTALSFANDPGGYQVPFEHFINNDTFITGNVGIGTTNLGAYKLSVNGGIHTKSVNVDMNGWPDYVFKPTYKLPTLAEVKAYIDKNRHLPEMPSEDEVIKRGLDLGEILKLQTKKIEELTLYLIEKDKQLKQQQDKITMLEAQRKEIDELKAQMAKLLK